MADSEQFDQTRDARRAVAMPRGWLVVGLALGSWIVVVAAVLGFMELHAYLLS